MLYKSQLMWTSLITIMLISNNINAQSIQVREATEQSWSGGIAGKRGQNYRFVIEFKEFANPPIPDTLWIGEHPVGLHSKEANYQQPNLQISNKANSITWTINAAINHDDQKIYPVLIDTPQKKAEPKPPIKYKGTALLCYSTDSGKKYFVISKNLFHYPPVNYP